MALVLRFLGHAAPKSTMQQLPRQLAGGATPRTPKTPSASPRPACSSPFFSNSGDHDRFLPTTPASSTTTWLQVPAASATATAAPGLLGRTSGARVGQQASAGLPVLLGRRDRVGAAPQPARGEDLADYQATTTPGRAREAYLQRQRSIEDRDKPFDLGRPATALAGGQFPVLLGREAEVPVASGFEEMSAHEAFVQRMRVIASR